MANNRVSEKKCKAAPRSPFIWVSISAVSERKQKMRGEGANGDKVLLLGYFFLFGVNW